MVSGLLLGAIYMTVAVAFTLTIGVLNFLNFTIPTLFMLTGMVAWALLSQQQLAFAGWWAWLVALLAGVAVAVAASLLVERFTFRYQKMKHGDATEHAIPLVSSLGFLIIFENLVLIYLGSESQRFAVPFRADVHIAGMVVGVAQIVSCLLAVARRRGAELHPARAPRSAVLCGRSRKIRIRLRCSASTSGASCRRVHPDRPPGRARRRAVHRQLRRGVRRSWVTMSAPRRLPRWCSAGSARSGARSSAVLVVGLAETLVDSISSAAIRVDDGLGPGPRHHHPAPQGACSGGASIGKGKM